MILFCLFYPERQTGAMSSLWLILLPCSYYSSLERMRDWRVPTFEPQITIRFGRQLSLWKRREFAEMPRVAGYGGWVGRYLSREPSSWVGENSHVFSWSLATGSLPGVEAWPQWLPSPSPPCSFQSILNSLVPSPIQIRPELPKGPEFPRTDLSFQEDLY